MRLRRQTTLGRQRSVFDLRRGWARIVVKEGQRFADQLAVLKDPMRGALARLPAVRHGNGEYAAGPVRGLRHETTGLDRDADGFFAEHVNARFQTIDGDGVVETVGQTEVGAVKAFLAREARW